MTSITHGFSHRLTFDLEAWFHAHNLRIPAREWASLPLRLERPTARILQILADYNATATFFVLGWVADRLPSLVLQIQSAGHEIASHGYGHKAVWDQSLGDFTADAARSKNVLEDLIGAPILGYRAPSYSIDDRTIWALDALEELGFRYDSSVYPVRAPHDRYGKADAPRFPHLIREGLWEIPLATVKLFGRELPALSGGYLRHVPWWIHRRALQQYEREGVGAVINLHPWEFDPDQPKRKAPVRDWFLHYGNLRTTRRRFVQLLKRSRFTGIGEWLQQVDPVSAGGIRVKRPQASAFSQLDRQGRAAQPGPPLDGEPKSALFDQPASAGPSSR